MACLGLILIVSKKQINWGSSPATRAWFDSFNISMIEKKMPPNNWAASSWLRFAGSWRNQVILLETAFTQEVNYWFSVWVMWPLWLEQNGPLGGLHHQKNGRILVMFTTKLWMKQYIFEIYIILLMVCIEKQGVTNEFEGKVSM